MTTTTTTTETPTDKAAYQWQCIDGIRKIIDHCFEIASNPVHTLKEVNRVAALHLALKSYLQIAEMIKDMKIPHYPSDNQNSNSNDNECFAYEQSRNSD